MKDKDLGAITAIDMPKADKPMTWMTTRDYFAAHAPDVPEWFQPDILALGHKVPVQQMERMKEWRYFYANVMLAEPEKSPEMPQK